jgi:hypothetical protein
LASRSPQVVGTVAALFLVLVLLFAAAGAALAQASDLSDHETSRFAPFLFIAMLLFGPALYVAPLLPVGIAGFALIRQVYDWWKNDRWLPPWWLYPVVFCAPFAAAAVLWRSAIGAAPFWPAVVVGLLAWHLGERYRGRPGFNVDAFRRQSNLVKLALLIGLPLLIWRAVAATRTFGLLLWVLLTPSDLGTPPYATQFEREMTLGTRLIARQFPDAQSCLEEGADATRHADLTRMDWDKIWTTTEAEVCIFRLLAALGRIEDFRVFSEAQGFRISETGSNPEKPYVERDGSLSVTVTWSIRKKGPKFPTRGPVRYLVAVPHSMGVDVTWEPDRTTLRHVNIFFNTL